MSILRQVSVINTVDTAHEDMIVSRILIVDQRRPVQIHGVDSNNDVDPDLASVESSFFVG